MSTEIKKNISPKYLVLIFFLMLGLSYASVPLYELFCRVTGFGGTIKFSKEQPTKIIDHVVSTRFDTNVAKGLYIDFKSEKNVVSIKAGQISKVKFYVKNLGDNELKIVSTFNATPDNVAKYFNKISCFCFEQQILKPKEIREFEMAYFIDPKIVDDNSAKNVKDITLSYTFFESEVFKKNKS